VLLVMAVVGRFGVAAIGGYGTASRLDYVLIPILFGLGTAVLTMVGTNIGAGNIARAKRIAWFGTVVSVTFTETVGLLVAIFPWLWIGLFTHDGAVLETGSLYFRIVAPLYAANGITFALGFAAQGSGRMGWIFLAGAIRLVIAAGGGWLAVAIFGFPAAGLFVLVAVALITAATICAAAALSGALWRTAANNAGAKARSS